MATHPANSAGCRLDRTYSSDLLPQIRTKLSMISDSVIGPLFLYHPESEFSAVRFPMSSRLAANSLAISFGVLSPSAL